MTARAARPVLATLAALLLLGALLSTAAAVGERIVVYGADLTAEERQELARAFGGDAGATVETVTAQELAAALQGTGLPVGPTDRSISSAALTCAGRGDGLVVRTQHITRIPASLYASALVTAGVSDAVVQLAAPASNPVTGEAALVGVLKAYPHCPGGRLPDAARARLAHEQVARTVALAGPDGDLDQAATVLLQAMQPVITGQAKDDAALGAALDRAAAGQGLALDPAQRGATVAFLGRLAELDYGAYGRGYRLQRVAPNEVTVIPADPGTPGAPPPPAAISRATAAPPARPESAGGPRPAGVAAESAARLRAAFVAYVPRLAGALALVVLGGAAAGLAARGAARLLADAGVARAGRLASLLRAGLLAIVAVLAAAILGVDVTLLIALAAIALGALALAAALALGLGLRELSRNVAGGRYVREGLAEGDRIVAGGVAGTVERIGVAMTTVRGADGRAYLVPNAYFLEHVVEREEATPGEGREGRGAPPA